LNVHQILDSLSGLGKVLLHGGIEDKVNWEKWLFLFETCW
jgi:hypothetical protein